MNYDISRTAIHLKPNPELDDFQSIGTILVGVGDPSLQSNVGACILNHKGAVGTARSITQFIADADDAMINNWLTCLGTEGVKRIVVEDLSLDTCFGLRLFLYRISGQENLNDRLSEWVSYISDWEQGFYPDKGSSPRDSVACIVSVLGHSYLNSGDIKAGLNACCDFLWELIKKFPNPHQVVFDNKSYYYRRAIGRYDYELGQLKATVEYGFSFQLMIPIGGSTERILTDAIVLTESEDLSGILKVLLRNDDAYSWTKRGFGLLALHRPREQGSGNDMTISVDPDTYLSLDKLWWLLEELENQRWEGNRPKGGDKGRRLQSYLDRHIAATDLPHQPWYDGRGGGARWSTLLGAPKSVQIGGSLVPGSKLDWNKDVLPTLWQAYSPIPENIILKKLNLDDSSGKKLAYVCWNTTARRDVISSPTFLGWLAAQSMDVAIRSPLDIPRPSAYQVLSLPGGLALIHREGVTLFDEATAIKFDEVSLTETVGQVSDCLAKYHKFIQDNWLKHALDGQTRLRTKGAKFSMKEFHTWQHQAAEAKGTLLEAMEKRFAQIETFDQTQLASKLEEYWGLAEHRAELLDMVERFDQVTQQIFVQLREKRDKFTNSLLAGLGSGLFAKEVLEPFKDKFTMNMYEWQIEMFRKNADLKHLERIAHEVASWELYTVGVFVAFFFAGFVLYWLNGSKIGAAE